MSVRCKGDVVGRFWNVANLWKQGVFCFESVQRLWISESDGAVLRT